jgi:hypothetical protein
MSGIGAGKQTGASAVTLRWDCPDIGIVIRAIRLVGILPAEGPPARQPATDNGDSVNIAAGRATTIPGVRPCWPAGDGRVRPEAALHVS